MPANPRSIALSVAIQDADRAIQALRGIGEAGEAAFLKMAANGNQAVRALEQVDGGLNRIKTADHGAAFTQIGSKVQNFSYQVNDLVVQIQGGQNAVLALVQQGSQILGAFGPVGAVLSVVAAGAGAVYTHFANVKDGARDTADVLKDVLEPGFRDASVEVDGYTEALRHATEQQKLFAGGVAGLNITSLKEQGGKTTQQFVESGVAEFRAKVTPKIPIEPQGLDLDQQLASGETFGVRRDREIARLSDELAGQLKAALEAGDPDKVLAIANQSGLTGDGEGAELATRLVETATKIRAQKALQDKTGVKAGFAPELARLQVQAQQLPAEFARMRPLAPVPVSKSDEAQAAYLERQEQTAKQSAAKAKVDAEAKARQAEAGKRLVEAMQLEADTAEKLATATSLGTVARQKAQIETEKEKKILEAGRTVKGQELEQYRQLAERVAAAQKKMVDLNVARERGLNQTPAGLRNQAERESMDKLADYNKERVRKSVADREEQEKQAAQRQTEILIQPWKDLASVAAQTTTEIFDQLLEKGKVSGGELAAGLNTSLRKSFAGLAGNLVTQPLQQEIAKIGAGEYSGITDFVKKNPALTTIGGSYLAGTALDMVRGKQTYAGLGGAVGAGAGAVIGSFIPGVGTLIGGAVGGALGTGIGSLFGAGGGLGNDNSQQSYVTGSRKIEYTDKSASTQNRAVTSGVLGQIQGLQESLEGLGASFRNTALNVQAGNKSGYQLNGVKYGSEQDLLQATIKELLRNAAGLSASQQTVLKNTKGRTTAEVLSDVEFARSYDRLTFKGTAFAQSLKDLDEQFAEASRKARDLGLDTKKLAEAQGKARQDLIEQGRDQLTGLEGQLRGQVQGISSFFDGLIEPLRAVANDNVDTLSPLAQINAARAKYREELALAQNGDVQGTRDLAGAAQALQQLSQRYLGNSGLGAEIARELRSGTSSVADRLEQQRAETLASLPQVQRETVAEMIRNTTRQTDRLVEELGKLRQELRQVGGLA